MSSKSNASELAAVSLLAVDDRVVTPSGSEAVVAFIHPEVAEATVQWPDGERARFRIIVLRRRPRLAQ